MSVTPQTTGRIVPDFTVLRDQGLLRGTQVSPQLVGHSPGRSQKPGIPVRGDLGHEVLVSSVTIIKEGTTLGKFQSWLTAVRDERDAVRPQEFFLLGSQAIVAGDPVDAGPGHSLCMVRG